MLPVAPAEDFGIAPGSRMKQIGGDYNMQREVADSAVYSRRTNGPSVFRAA